MNLNSVVSGNDSDRWIEDTIGRARLEKKGDIWCILVKRKLEDKFDTLPRPVKHVGSEKYIKSIWRKIQKNHTRYEKNPKTFP
jgi:hypothetical protein